METPKQLNIYCPQCNTWMVVPDQPGIMNARIACPKCHYEGLVSSFPTSPKPIAQPVNQDLVSGTTQISGEKAQSEAEQSSDTVSAVAANASETEPSGKESGKLKPMHLAAIIAAAVLLLAGVILAIVLNSRDDEGDVISGPVVVPDVVVDGHAAVDLGLPSGLLWAKVNLGATTPGSFGSRYAWGETYTKSQYTKTNYNYYYVIDNRAHDYYSTKYTSYSNNYLYSPDYNYSLSNSDDAASLTWGPLWKIPSMEEFAELVNNCNWTWTTMDGTPGFRVSSKTNSNSIFLPAAGKMGQDSKYAYDQGFYWTSDLYTDNDTQAWYYRLYQNSSGENKIEPDSYGRFYGLSIRPVTNN